MRYLAAIFLLCASGLLQPAIADTIETTNFRALFAEAIDSPNGNARTEVRGALLEKMQSEIKTNARIFVDVKTIGTLKQPGCKRLQVLFSAPESRLPTKDGGVAPLKGVGFQLNMCRDGRPPMQAQ